MASLSEPLDAAAAGRREVERHQQDLHAGSMVVGRGRRKMRMRSPDLVVPSPSSRMPSVRGDAAARPRSPAGCRRRGAAHATRANASATAARAASVAMPDADDGRRRRSSRSRPRPARFRRSRRPRSGPRARRSTRSEPRSWIAQGPKPCSAQCATAHSTSRRAASRRTPRLRYSSRSSARTGRRTSRSVSILTLGPASRTKAAAASYAQTGGTSGRRHAAVKIVPAHIGLRLADRRQRSGLRSRCRPGRARTSRGKS